MGEERNTREGLISPEDIQEEPSQPRMPGQEAAASGGGQQPKADARVGTVLDGRFRVKRLVARGGMGRIYEAVQEPLGRRVALKVMDLGYSEELDPDFQKRFLLEAATCARLSHPNTIRVFDYGHADDDTYYIVMEFIDGLTLLELIDQQAPLDPLRVLHIARQICASLTEAHGQGVIHRDLKPSNVLLTRHGEQEDFVKVLDFGLVKLLREDAEEMTRSGLFLGSPNYMSPEQIRSGQIDQRADLYSLGVILYMALTGRSPFKRNSQVNVLLAQLEDDPPPFNTTVAGDSVPPCVEWVVMTCLAKEPSSRFASVTELNRALKVCDAVILGQVEQPALRLERGRMVLPESVDEAIATQRFASVSGVSGPSRAGMRVPPRPDPIPSAGSIASRRTRPGQESEPGSGGSVSRLRSGPPRKRKPRSRMDRLLTSPAFAMFLGAMVVLLIAALVLLTLRLVDEKEQAELPGPSDGTGTPATGVVPDLGPAGPSPAEEGSQPATPAEVRPVGTQAPRPRPSAAPTPRPEPSPRPSPAPSPTPAAAGTPEPASTPTPAPTPEPTKVRGDLRDPWGG